MIIPVNLGEQSYDIILKRDALGEVGSYINLDRKVLIVTDGGVPSEYANKVCSECREGYVVVINEGEGSKNFDNYKFLLSKLLEYSFTRTDCVIAVGGGVVGDLSGFVASSYMRGIDFYNIPTTLLSQIDSSIGGKVAVDFMGVKNVVGAFYQPKKVIIDPDVLKTLDKRQLHAGLAEAIKMAATSDKELFEIIEKSENLENDIDVIIEKSLNIKREVVEKDPREKGLRRVLNFGHTVGHAIESDNNLGGLLHGECVALGMLPMCSESVRKRLKKVLEKYSLPTEIETDSKTLISYISHDKKASGDFVTSVFSDEIGTFRMEKINIEEFAKIIDGGFRK